MCDSTISVLEAKLEINEDLLNRLEARHNTYLHNLVNIENDCDIANEKLTVMQASLKKWTGELSKKDMTDERKKIVIEELKKMELALNGFDGFEYGIRKLHSEYIAKCKANACFQSRCQENIRQIIVDIDQSEAKFGRNCNQAMKELIELRSRVNRTIWVSENIAESFERLEGSQTYSDERLSEFNDHLDKVCREFNAVRKRIIKSKVY